MSTANTGAGSEVVTAAPGGASLKTATPVPAAGSILVIDVGGTHVKVQSEANLMAGAASASVDADPKAEGEAETTAETGAPIKIASGPDMTAQVMVDQVRKNVQWPFQAVSIGYPGPVLHGRPVAEPRNLGSGWMGFDFEAAFQCPVRLVNDAAMQALGSYEGGRMLFLGLGTGLGSTMIVDGILEPLELAHLPYKKKKTYEDFVGLRGMKRLGKKKWRREVDDVVVRLRQALEPDYVVLGGGNAKFLKELPDGVKLGTNENAFLGGIRLWRGTLQSQTGPAASAPVSETEPVHSFRVG